MNTFFARMHARQLPTVTGIVTDMQDPTGTRRWGAGWSAPMADRLSSELVLMLAFVHHLVYSMKMSRLELRRMFEAVTTRWLLVEVAPRPSDPDRGRETFFNLEWMLETVEDAFVREECWYHGKRDRCLVLLRKA